MGTTAQDVITRAARILNDEGYTRWTNTEMFSWLSDGQAEAIALNNRLYTKKVVRTLVDGCVQDFSGLNDYYMLLDVVRNMGTTGTTPGRTVNKADLAVINAVDPYWQTGAAESPTQHYMFSADRRYEYLVYPPAAAGNKVEILYCATPPRVTALTDTLALSDMAAPALVDYLCYRAESKDAEFGDVPQLAAAHYKLFTDAIARL